MINCADVVSAPTIGIPTDHLKTLDPDRTLRVAGLVSGHSSECPALFRYPQSYVGSTVTTESSRLNADRLIADLNRVMPG